MDPYFFYSGFSDRWYEKILIDHKFTISEIEPVGDYYNFMAVELFRTMRSHHLLSSIFLLPTFIWYLLKKPTNVSVNTLCSGYHVLARKN